MDIGLLTKDIEYATRLVTFVRQERLDHRFCFQLFTTVDNFMQATHRNNCQIIIAEEELHAELIQRCGLQIPILLLTETFNNDEDTFIFKFRPASYVLDCIRKYSNAEKRITTHLEHSGVIMISSSYPGVGKTTAALAIANELARNGKKIFYFSLEHWVNEDIYSNTNASSEANFSHLYYLQQTNPQGIKKWLSNHSFLIKDSGCETLMPFLHPEDRLKLSSKESIEMLQAIMQSGLYHYVIVELEAGYDEFQLSMLEYANVHFIADYENVRLQNKSKQMIAYLRSQLDSEQQLSAFEKAIYLKRSNHNRQEHVSLQKSDRASYTLPYIEQGLQAFQAPIYRAVIAKCLQDMRSVGELVS